MRVLIFIDAKNFENGIINLSKKRKEFRFIDWHKLNIFIMDYLKNNLQYRNCDLFHIRTYFYTGEFTDKLLQKIEKYLEENSESVWVKDLIERSKKDQEKQETFFKIAKNYYFFEIKAKPLQFSYSDQRIFQKGVDVQLAVDLVDFAHKDIYDIAILLSGDIDLLEPIINAKSMGKQIIILGDESVTAEEIKRSADLFIDLGRMNAEQLNKFTHISNYKKC
ncbi:NYN domain-containing protein [Candidatus Pacearchaeota archaeon]|nr:NYN domain-containing protein [Candidatus Pacearchaeota archaeon]